MNTQSILWLATDEQAIYLHIEGFKSERSPGIISACTDSKTYMKIEQTDVGHVEGVQ